LPTKNRGLSLITMEGNDPQEPQRDPLDADARLLERWPEIACKVRKSLARTVPARDLDDVMQETAITVLLHNRTREIRSLIAFAHKTANFLAKRSQRSARREPRSIDENSTIDSLQEAMSNTDRASQHRSRESLLSWLKELPPRRAEVVQLALRGHGSVAAIAEAMACTEANVRQHLDHAIEQLRARHEIESESLPPRAPPEGPPR
jgi:RNA polymerase sigma factor (sigma-70 family)